MIVTYGQGTYSDESKECEGQILLGEHKVYLKQGEQELAQTYIPLEKIDRLKLKSGQLILSVRPAIMSSYQAVLKGDKKNISALALEIAKRRGFKKLLLRNEWFEDHV